MADCNKLFFEDTLTCRTIVSAEHFGKQIKSLSKIHILKTKIAAESTVYYAQNGAVELITHLCRIYCALIDKSCSYNTQGSLVRLHDHGLTQHPYRLSTPDAREYFLVIC